MTASLHKRARAWARLARRRAIAFCNRHDHFIKEVEHWGHAGYLGGVALGGGYKYIAGGLCAIVVLRLAVASREEVADD